LIAILDANIGNLRSVFNAVDTMGFDAKIVTHAELSDKYTHLIIPGVGSFIHALQSDKIGAVKGEIRTFANSGRPVLGICVGMQLLADWGDEGGGSVGLSLIPGQVKRLPEPEGVLLPHVGWNTVNIIQNHPIFQGIKKDIDCYFVHSYHFICDNNENVYGRSNYGVDFVSVVGKGNIIGFQFHPEKSQNNGLKLIENFCDWTG